MAKWWVINTNTQAFIALCDDEERPLPSLGLDQVAILVPGGIAPGNAKVLDTAGVLSLIDGAADKAGPRWDALRTKRDAALAACDWTQGSDSPLAATPKASWASYRTYLRAIPQVATDPDTAVIQTYAQWNV